MQAIRQEKVVHCADEEFAGFGCLRAERLSGQLCAAGAHEPHRLKFLWRSEMHVDHFFSISVLSLCAGVLAFDVLEKAWLIMAISGFSAAVELVPGGTMRLSS